MSKTTELNSLSKSAVVQLQAVDQFPRVLLKADIDLTYRCNNRCLHCWLWKPADAPEAARELSLEEIRRIAGEARALGVREWTISGGEPMLRPDFPEVFDELTRKSRYYTLKTNGTLITAAIARLLKRPGEVWVSIYGATPEVYDRVARRSGAFKQSMKGISLLKEAGVQLVVQAFPMRENWHQWQQMVELARSLSPIWRVGAAWLNLSADGDPLRNTEIASQRLDPKIVVELDRPTMLDEPDDRNEGHCEQAREDDQLLAACVESRRELHIDPYGGLSVCCVIKDPSLRYDLKRGTVREGWEVFIPSLADEVRGSETYRKGCGQCEWRADCRWCPTYAYLEHRDHTAKIEYLCSIAEEVQRFKALWELHHRRHFRIGGIDLQVDSDLPFTETTLQPAISVFRVDGSGPGPVKIRHHFSHQGLVPLAPEEEIHRQGPWTVYRKGGSWIYRCGLNGVTYSISVFNNDHTRGTIYHADDASWLRGGLNTLSLPVTDQILLTRLLADRGGCILHSAGVILDGKGFLFIGHSEAGKTTVTRLLEAEGEILCDDRNIVRRDGAGFRVYGTWSHGDSPSVSAASAPLRAALFLEKSDVNRMECLTDRKEIIRRLIACLIRGLEDSAWWHKNLDVIEAFSRAVPCYRLEFEKSGDLAPLLRSIDG